MQKLNPHKILKVLLQQQTKPAVWYPAKKNETSVY